MNMIIGVFVLYLVTMILAMVTGYLIGYMQWRGDEDEGEGIDELPPMGVGPDYGLDRGLEQQSDILFETVKKGKTSFKEMAEEAKKATVMHNNPGVAGLYTSKKSGDWNDPDTWDPPGVPGEDDIKLVKREHNVELKGDGKGEPLPEIDGTAHEPQGYGDVSADGVTFLVPPVPDWAEPIDTLDPSPPPQDMCGHGKEFPVCIHRAEEGHCMSIGGCALGLEKFGEKFNAFRHMSFRLGVPENVTKEELERVGRFLKFEPKPGDTIVIDELGLRLEQVPRGFPNVKEWGHKLVMPGVSVQHPQEIKEDGP